MGPRSQYPKSFPFLSLPPELQAEVVRHVGDLVALRALLAIPQVLRSVGPFVRLVTNGRKPLWFRGLEKHVVHTKAPDGLPKTLDGSSRAVIYIVDLDYNLYSELEMYAFLRKPIVVFTIQNSQDDEDEYPVSENIQRFVSVTGTENVGIVAATEACNINITPNSTMLSPNLTLVDLHSVYARPTDDPMCSQYPSLLPPIRFAGALSSLLLEYVPPPDEAGSVVYDRYEELINSAGNFEISPDSLTDGDWAKELTLSGLQIAQLTKRCHIIRCIELSNLKINTCYTHENSDVLKHGELFLEVEYAMEQEIYKPPEIRHVVAPGLRKLTIKTLGPFFPVMESLWFPHLESLKLTGFNGIIGYSIRFDHLDISQLEEVSKLLHRVKYLHLDQFMMPLLGYVAPFALENLTTLTVQEVVPQNDMPVILEHVETLKARYGKIRMPKLKELHWISACYDEEKVLDFTQLSKWFTFPRVKSVVFKTFSESVSLKDIAYQTPRIKSLKITKPDPLAYDGLGVNTGLYPTPHRDLPRHVTFERLERLVVHTGYHSSMFDDILFPHLKSLDLSMTLQNAWDTTVEANMPVLEELFITEATTPESLLTLYIGEFKSLRKLALNCEAASLWFKTDMTKLEEITHIGKGLREIRATHPASLDKLKVLRYTSVTGKACHKLFVSPSVVVDIR